MNACVRLAMPPSLPRIWIKISYASSIRQLFKNKNEHMKTRSTNFNVSKELTLEDVGEGLKRQIMGYDGQLMMVKVLFEKGAIGYVHEHFHSQTTYIVRGKFEIMINGEKRILEEGDGFYIEPDVPHGAVCLESGILIDVFSPIRAEFLKK
jgi:quercetin dioxygenase-like cupin family protein